MAFTARTLIARSYYTSRIVARNAQNISGNQTTDGLFLLNDLLEITGSATSLIPYYRPYSGVFINSTETYFIQGLYEVETMTYTIGDVRYPMSPASRKDYFGSARANNISSLPYTYRVERKLNGANVSVYFLPNDTYPFQIFGKFGLTDVTLDTDLSLTYDGNYLVYLRYALAEYICDYNSVNLSPQAARKLIEIKKTLRNLSPPDLKLQKSSTLGKSRVFNYAQANLGNGYTPT